MNFSSCIQDADSVSFVIPEGSGLFGYYHLPCSFGKGEAGGGHLCHGSVSVHKGVLSCMPSPVSEFGQFLPFLDLGVLLAPSLTFFDNKDWQEHHLICLSFPHGLRGGNLTPSARSQCSDIMWM